MIGLGALEILMLCVLIVFAIVICARGKPTKRVGPLFILLLGVPLLLMLAIGNYLLLHRPPNMTATGFDGWEPNSLSNDLATHELLAADGGEMTWAGAQIHRSLRFTLGWMPILLTGGLVVGGLLLFANWLRTHRDRSENSHFEGRRGGWGWAIVLLCMIGILPLFAVFTWQGQRSEYVGPQPSNIDLRQRAERRPRTRQIQSQRAQAEGQLQTALSVSELDIEKPRIKLESPVGDVVTIQKTATPQTAEAAPAESTNAAAGQVSVTAHALDDQHTDDTGEKVTRGLRIQLDGQRLNQYKVSFAEVVGRFLNDRTTKLGPVRIDSDTLSIELDELPANVKNLLDLRLFNRGDGRTVSLTDLAQTIATTDGEELTVTLPNPPRPAWVDQPSQRSGGVWRVVVAAGEYVTAQECYRRADELLYIATWERLQMLIAGRKALPGGERLTASAVGADAQVNSDAKLDPAVMHKLLAMGIDLNFIRREIVVRSSDGSLNEYLETAQRSVGPMKTLYTQLEFSPSVDAQLMPRWIKVEQHARVAAVSKTGFLALALVGLAYGLLKIDTLTRGYYSKRLFLGVPAIIMGIVLLLVLLRLP